MKFQPIRALQLILLGGLLGTAPTAFPQTAVTESVSVEQGLIVGTVGRSPGVRVYRGVPFAAPPIGDLRWKPPQPAPAWQGVRQATRFGNACAQPPFPVNGLYGSSPPSISEDCLNLNIWTPAKFADDHLPVMVWIYGGGFEHGTGAAIAYDGENLCRKGAVIVTINYRLGIFGFLALPELAAESPHRAAGNYALMDQIAALQWVQHNIAAFGGDPSRVAIFGESAGSISVNVLMASPLAQGLFTRAIGESGGSVGPMPSLAEAENQGQKFASAVGATHDVLQTLRAKSADELIKATAESDVNIIVDGWVLPQTVYSIFAQGKQNDVALLVGSNANEGSLFPPPNGAITPAEFISNAQKRFGPMSREFLKTYPPGSTNDEAAAAYYASFRDGQIEWGMRMWARLATETGHRRAYRYYFARVPPGPGERLGAFHGSEIAYVFENFPYRLAYQAVDKQLGELIATYWTNFARTGDPNGSGTFAWPIYTQWTDAEMVFDVPVSVHSHINADGLDFFDMFYRAIRPSREPSAPFDSIF